VRLQILFVCIKKYQQAFWCRCQGTVVVFSLNRVHPHIFYLTKKSDFFYLFTMKPPTFQTFFALKGEFPEPSPSSKPNQSSSCELHPSLIAMVWAQPFFGYDDKNPCNHLLEFEEMCSFLSISGMAQETLKWKLFLSLSRGR
jgi:hypothetical protein